MSQVYQELESIFTSGVSEEYLGEDVRLVEHMLQCADLARFAGAPEHLIVAALLHDLGHLLLTEASSAHENGIDLHHDEVGARWVATRFPGTVSEPIRLHVEAKRYLITTQKNYLSQLSHSSVQTLYMQGGPLNQEEVMDFISREGAEDAVQLRLWDDAAKVRGKPTSSLRDFENLINSLAISK